MERIRRKNFQLSLDCGKTLGMSPPCPKQKGALTVTPLWWQRSESLLPAKTRVASFLEFTIYWNGWAVGGMCPRLIRKTRRSFQKRKIYRWVSVRGPKRENWNCGYTTAARCFLE